MTYVTYGQTELRHVMSEIEDLDKARAALIRETVIRSVMAETGEPREIVVEMIDAMDAMDSMAQEVVEELIQGEPTTLPDALDRYVDRLFDWSSSSGPSGDDIRGQEIGWDLTAILNYPFPGPCKVPCAACGAVDGIRPHLPLTLEEDRECQGMAESVAPVTREDLKRQGLLPG